MQPDYVQVVWKEKATRRQYVSVAVLLTSGDEKLRGNIKATIDGYETLVLRFYTPLALRKSELLHARWITGQNGVSIIEDYHQSIAVIDQRKEAQGPFREKSSRITLPFAVRPRLTKNDFLG